MAKTNFISGVQEELKHVTWPTRTETLQLTGTVIIISLIVAAFVGIIDISLTKVLEFLAR
jgi:preprotein translocase subunit SecE